MPNRRLLLAAASIAIVAVACSGSPGASPSSPAPSGSPQPTAEPSPSGGFSHPTGASEIILRMEEGGGFVPAEFAATNVPYFTLYGDGTVIFRGDEPFPEPAEGTGLMTWPALRTAKLSEEQIQSLLEFAIAEGGLAAAKEKYENPMVADAGTTTFLINAGDVEKRVEVYALGLDAEPNADSAVKASLLKLAERLRSFDQGGTIASDEYQPPAHMGILWETGVGVGGPAPRPWPWADLTPADFTAPPDNEFGFPRHELTPDEVSALGIELPKGAVSGISLAGPDGKVYGLALRPLLPDELG